MSKKNILSAICIVFVLASCHNTQNKEHVFTPMQCDSIDFVIEGIVSDGADSLYFNERPYTDTKSYSIKDGRFSIKVRQPLYKFVQIEDGNDGWMLVIVDSVMNRVVVDFNTNTVVEGSPLNKRFNHYQLIEDSLWSQLNELDSDEGPEYEELNNLILETAWRCIMENMYNMIPVYTLSLSGQFPFFTYEQLTECMKDEYEFTHHPEMEIVWKFYWDMQKRLPGQKYHDIELADTSGTMHKLSEYVGKGNYVLVDFWASWCGPCLMSMPMMKDLYDTYSDRGLQIIGISFDDNKANWIRAIEREKLPWVHLSDLNGWESIGAKTYGIRAIPETVLISPDGKIIATGLREELLKAKIEEIFSRK